MHTQWRSCQDWKDQGLRMSTSSDEACKLYDALLSQYIGWYNDGSLGGMNGTLDKIKAADPDFVMGQVITNGLGLFGMGRNIRTDAALRNDINRMVDLVLSNPNVTQRERKHADALDIWSNGDRHTASRIWEDILIEYPTDVLALKFAYETYFYSGQSHQIRDTVARVVPEWKPHMPLYGNILSMHAFGLVETNVFPQAEARATEALSINPRDSWATHTLGHVYEMTGRYGDGLDMYEKTASYWQSCDILACHNTWHWALYNIEIGKYETALSIYDEKMKSRADNYGGCIVDATSLLFRLEMEGVNVGKRWDKLYATCKPHLHDQNAIFLDLHVLLSCLGSGAKEAVEELMDSIHNFIMVERGTNRDATAQIGETILKSFISYNNGDYASAVDLLEPVRYRVNEIGGSNAQRDLVNVFLIQAAIKSPKTEHHRLARALLNERKSWRPDSPMIDRLMARAVALHAD